MLLDAADRAEMVDALGDPATLPSGKAVMIAMGENVLAASVMDKAGDVGLLYPDGLISSDDVVTHGIVDGEDGTVITILGRQYRVNAIVQYSDGFSGIDLLVL